MIKRDENDKTEYNHRHKEEATIFSEEPLIKVHFLCWCADKDKIKNCFRSSFWEVGALEDDDNGR